MHRNNYQTSNQKEVAERIKRLEISEYSQEIISVKESPEKMDLNEIEPSQKDFKNTSLSLKDWRKDYKIPKKSTTNSYDEQIREIDEMLKKRHHVATLGYTLDENLKHDQIPKFLNVFIEFNPYFGSQEAMDLFKNEIKNLKASASREITEKLINICDGFTEKTTNEAEKLVKKLGDDIGDSTEEQRKEQSEYLTKINNIHQKWNEEFEQYLKNRSERINNPKNSRRERNHPYRRN